MRLFEGVYAARGQRLAEYGDATVDFGSRRSGEGDAEAYGGRRGWKRRREVEQGWYVQEKLSSEVSSWVARSNLIQLS